MHRSRLPILRPCDEEFASMRHVETAVGVSRHCERCEKVVTDLSTMTRRQAEVFVRTHGRARPCVRYRVRRDGTLRFVPEPTSASLVRAAAVFGILLAAPGLVGCAGYADAADLDAPAAAETCEDVAGYTIPCADTAEGPDTVADDETPAPTPTVPAGDPVIPTEADATMPATGEGCPIPPPAAGTEADEAYGYDGDDFLTGVMIDRDYTPGPSRAQQREETLSRREARRAERRRKRARRKAKRWW